MRERERERERGVNLFNEIQIRKSILIRLNNVIEFIRLQKLSSIVQI